MEQRTETVMTEPERLEQAADWLDRIDELNAQDKEIFALWLKDEANRSAFNRMASALSQPEIQLAAQRIHQAANRNTVSIRPLRKSRWVHASLASAASVAIAALLFFTQESPQHPASSTQVARTTLTASNSQQAQFSTAVGESRSANLLDGSIVYLNGDTQLQVNHNDSFREVSLTSGQAYFDIAHEPNRPFIVQLDTASVRVVGTAFDIDRLADKTEIRVYEGIVSVNADKNLMLHKGEGAILEAGKWQTTFKLDDAQLPQWRTGWLDVSNQPVGDIVLKLNRYASKPIRVTGNRDFPVSGRFNLKKPELALQLLTAMDDLTLTEMDDYYQLSVAL